MPDEFGGSGWCYVVSTDDACRAPLFTGNCGDVLGPVSLEPGSSLQINVSPYHLSRGSAIETYFHFGWEPYSREMRHSVRFGYSALPSKVQKALLDLDPSSSPRPVCYENPARSNSPLVKIPLPAPPSSLTSPLSPFAAPPPKDIPFEAKK